MRGVILFFVLLLNVEALDFSDIQAMKRANVKISFAGDSSAYKIPSNMRPKRLIQANYLGFNGVTLYEIPNFVTKMKNLKKLDLNGAGIGIEELSKLKSLQKLEMLNLSNNPLFSENKKIKLSSILSGFELTELDLSYTGGSSSDYANLGVLSYLVKLNLSGNRISNLKTLGLKNLYNLESLNLSSNSLSYSFTTKDLPKGLRGLYLSNNDIRKFDFKGDFYALEILDVSKNSSLSFDKKYGGLLFLKELRKLGINDDIAIPKGLKEKLNRLLKPIRPKMIRIHRGSFIMGSNSGDSDEKPPHKVTINYDFYIGKYEVTFEEYDIFCQKTGRAKPSDSGWGRGKRPVINVSWNDAKAYSKWLSKKTGQNYRLPTESEWEYVARAGTKTKWSFGSNESRLVKYAWYTKNSGSKTHRVGEKDSNPWGLKDIHGNVWEWCEDWYVDNYESTPKNGNSNDNGNQQYKVIRGGSWYYDASVTRSAIRYWYSPSSSSFNVGFRLLRTLP